jgi:hypothetical protein
MSQQDAAHGAVTAGGAGKGTVACTKDLGLFHGHDPFKEFSPDPFARGGIHSSLRSGFGRVMEEMERDLLGGALGMRPMFPSTAGEMSAPRGTYSIQTATMSSFMGPDGKMHTEQFASSDVGHREQDIRETHQAYHNSATGVSKMALEQHLGVRARKKVREVGKAGEEQNTELFRGLEEAGREEFDKAFTEKASSLPEHRRFDTGILGGLGSAFEPLKGLASWSRPALQGGA